MSCAKTKVGSKIDATSYSLLKTVGARKSPSTLNALESWLTEGGLNQQWDGKLYVASTIIWDSDSAQFRQYGCSPNYRGGLWTLACCKHDMRTGKPFRAKALDQSIPTYVFTLAKMDPRVGQSLVSVARIDDGFETMDEYSQFLEGQKRVLQAAKLTRTRREDGLFGWRFGDCHADANFQVGRPDCDHVHADEAQWKRDCNGKHMILISTKFIVWDRPVFSVRETEGQSRFGRNMEKGALESFFKNC